jgi:hypothetical protein
VRRKQSLIVEYSWFKKKFSQTQILIYLAALALLFEAFIQSPITFAQPEYALSTVI